MRQIRFKYLVFFMSIVGIGLATSNSSHLQLLTFIGIYTLLALGLNMLMGYAGQISLGHAAFYGLGAYTTGILTVHWHWSPWLALPVALLLTGAIAFTVALPIFRLSGYYLGMGTLGIGMIAYTAFRKLDGLTGGDSGLVGIPFLSIGPVTFNSMSAYFYLVWSVVFFCFLICERIVDSRVGRALRAIHDSERAAAAVGIDAGRVKVAIFILSAMFASLAGFLYAHLVSFVSPNSFDFLMSIRMVTMVAVGGMASIWGSLIGASLLTVLPECLHVFTDYEMVAYGLILMFIMVFLPQGVVRGILDIYDRSRARIRQPATRSQG